MYNVIHMYTDQIVFTGTKEQCQEYIDKSGEYVYILGNIIITG